MTEPVITWNLFLTLILVPVSVALLGYFVRGWFSDQKKGWEKYEEERVANQAKWMERIEEAIAGLTTAVRALERQVFGKVNDTIYNVDKKESDGKIGEQDKRIYVLEVKVRDIKEIMSGGG